jgi:hypothetical protein
MSNFVRGARTPACSVHTRVNASEVGQPIPAVIPKHFVLQPIPFFARRDDFVGQVGNLRPIGNRPACSARNSGPTPAQFAACRYVGQVGNLRPIVNRPAATCPISQADGCGFAVCRLAGQVGNQVGNLRPIGGALWARPLRPATRQFPASEVGHALACQFAPTQVTQ